MQFNKIPAHIVVTASAWISRIIIAGVQLVSVRILLQSLGDEKYAVFALLSGLTGWFLLADLSIGYSAQNFVSETRAKNEGPTEIVKAAVLSCFALVITWLLLLLALSNQLGPMFLKQFTFLTEEQKTRLFFAFGALSMTSGLGAVAYRVWYSQHKGYLSNVIPAFAAIIGLAGLKIVTGSSLQNKLLWSLTAYVAPTAAFALISLAAHLRQPIHNLHFHVFEKLFRRASHFFFFQLMGSAVVQFDYIVISQFLPSQKIIIYAIATKVFTLAAFAYTSALLAIWPVCTELITRNQWRSVMHLVRKYIWAGSAFIFLCTVILMETMPSIAHILSPKSLIIVPTRLIVLLGVYQLIRVWTDTHAIVLQSMSDLKPLLKSVPLQAVICVVLEWTLAPKWGAEGIVVGLIASYLLTVTWWLPLSVQKHTRGAQILTLESSEVPLIYPEV